MVAENFLGQLLVDLLPVVILAQNIHGILHANPYGIPVALIIEALQLRHFVRQEHPASYWLFFLAHYLSVSFVRRAGCARKTLLGETSILRKS